MKPLYERSFTYCRALEVPVRKDTLTHDTFIDGLTLNYEEIEPFELDVVEYAKALAKTRYTGATSLRDVSLPENVFDLDSYRDERNKPRAA